MVLPPGNPLQGLLGGGRDWGLGLCCQPGVVPWGQVAGTSRIIGVWPTRTPPLGQVWRPRGPGTRQPSASFLHGEKGFHPHRLEYCDEAVRDPSQAPPVDIHQPPAFLHKLLQLSGVCLHSEELPAQVGRPASHTPPLTL